MNFTVNINGNLRAASVQELGQSLLMFAGTIPQDFTVENGRNLAEIFKIKGNEEQENRFFCEWFIFRMFAVYVSCVSRPKLKFDESWRFIIDSFFKSFYEYVEKEPAGIFLKVMNVNSCEELEQEIIHPRWKKYLRDFNKETVAGKVVNMGTSFSVIFNSGPKLIDREPNSADFNAARCMHMGLQFFSCVMATDESLSSVSPISN